MASRKLRDGGRRLAAPLDDVQPLPAPLRRTQAGARQRRLVWQADPFGVPRAADPSVGHKVSAKNIANKLLQLSKCIVVTVTLPCRHFNFKCTCCTI